MREAPARPHTGKAGSLRSVPNPPPGSAFSLQLPPARSGSSQPLPPPGFPLGAGSGSDDSGRAGADPAPGFDRGPAGEVAEVGQRAAGGGGGASFLRPGRCMMEAAWPPTSPSRRYRPPPSAPGRRVKARGRAPGERGAERRGSLLPRPPLSLPRRLTGA